MSTKYLDYGVADSPPQYRPVPLFAGLDHYLPLLFALPHLQESLVEQLLFLTSPVIIALPSIRDGVNVLYWQSLGCVSCCQCRVARHGLLQYISGD
jgi:hypothetical protein